MVNIKQKKSTHHATKQKEEKTTKKSNGLNTKVMLFIIGAIALIAIVTGLILTNKPNTTTSNTSEKVKVDFYVMSQCPYGTQVEDAIAPVLNKIGQNVDFNLNFIASDKGDGTFQSLHGQNEVLGNIVQLCAIKYEPTKYMDMIVCQNKNANLIPSNWETCAKTAGFTQTDKVKTCYEGQEGKTLHSESIKKSEAVNAQGSPTIYIAGNAYGGARGENDFLRAICASYKAEKPSACLEIPECVSNADCVAQVGKEGKCENPGDKTAKCVYSDPVKFTVTVINDKRCAECDTAYILQVTNQLFAGAQIVNLDYSSPDAKAMMQKYGITLLPAYVFDGVVDQTNSWTTNPRLQTAFKKEADKYYLLPSAVGAEFDPTAEICDNKVDDNNNGKIDCEDTTCATTFACNKQDVAYAEVFVMTHCPYGTQVEKGVLPVVDALGSKGNITIRFVHYFMHGDKEEAETYNQVCIREEQNDKYYAYLKCFLNASDSPGCLVKTGVDQAKLNTCLDTKAKDYYAIDSALSNKYGVGGSPTVVINGAQVDANRDSASLLSLICSGYKNAPAECSTQLSSTAPSPGFGYAQTGASSNTQAQC